MTNYRPRGMHLLLLVLGTLGSGLFLWHFAAGASAAKAVAQSKGGDVDEQTIRRLIEQLGDDSFDKREEADKRLAAIGEPALALLNRAFQHS